MSLWLWTIQSGGLKQCAQTKPFESIDFLVFLVNFVGQYRYGTCKVHKNIWVKRFRSNMRRICRIEEIFIRFLDIWEKHWRFPIENSSNHWQAGQNIVLWSRMTKKKQHRQSYRPLSFDRVTIYVVCFWNWSSFGFSIV